MRRLLVGPRYYVGDISPYPGHLFAFARKRCGLARAQPIIHHPVLRADHDTSSAAARHFSCKQVVLLCMVSKVKYLVAVMVHTFSSEGGMIYALYNHTSFSVDACTPFFWWTRPARTWPQRRWLSITRKSVLVTDLFFGRASASVSKTLDPSFRLHSSRLEPREDKKFCFVSQHPTSDKETIAIRTYGDSRHRSSTGEHLSARWTFRPLDDRG
jgi:hypothetical protein